MQAVVVCRYRPPWPRTREEAAWISVDSSLSRLVLEGSEPVRGQQPFEVLPVRREVSREQAYDLEIIIVLMPDPDAERVAAPIANRVRDGILHSMQVEGVATTLKVSCMVAHYTTTVESDGTVHASNSDDCNEFNLARRLMDS